MVAALCFFFEFLHKKLCKNLKEKCVEVAATLNIVKLFLVWINRCFDEYWNLRPEICWNSILKVRYLSIDWSVKIR